MEPEIFHFLHVYRLYFAGESATFNIRELNFTVISLPKSCIICWSVYVIIWFLADDNKELFTGNTSAKLPEVSKQCWTRCLRNKRSNPKFYSCHTYFVSRIIIVQECSLKANDLGLICFNASVTFWNSDLLAVILFLLQMFLELLSPIGCTGTIIFQHAKEKT